MSEEYQLRLKFGTMTGTKTWNFKHALPDVDGTAVKKVMNTIITNGSIYKNPPLTAESAELIKTEVTTLDIS